MRISFCLHDGEILKNPSGMTQVHATEDFITISIFMIDYY